MSVEDAQKKGLKGYKLVAAVDTWYGEDNPGQHEPWILLEEDLGNKDGKLDMKDWQKIGLPEAHFNYFDGDKDGELNKTEVFAWFMQRSLVQTADLSEVESPPQGHKGRLGAWRKPLNSDHLVYQKPYPHPREFWHKHMDGYEPALFKGAQHGWPCMNWTKEALKERFGWVETRVESALEVREIAESAAQKKMAPKDRTNISTFLSGDNGQDVYVISVLPQAMAWEVGVPTSLMCGSRTKYLDLDTDPPYGLKKHDYPHEEGHDWMTHIFETDLWVATGKTRSQLHYDKEWNVNCLISGRKKWFFLNTFNVSDRVHWARGGLFKRDNPLNNGGTDWVWLDPHNVDLIVQHGLRDSDYYEWIQEPGDCVFIPYAMLHQVEKLDDEFTVAVSFMFLPESVYSEQACSKAPLDEELPLAAMDVLFAYTGKGMIPIGYKDPREFIEELKKAMKEKGEDFLSLETFSDAVTKGTSELSKAPGRARRIRELYKLLGTYVEDIEENNMNEIPLRVWCKAAAEGDSQGREPYDEGHEYRLYSEEELGRMQKRIERALARQAKKGDREKVRMEPAPGKIFNQRAWKLPNSSKVYRAMPTSDPDPTEDEDDEDGDDEDGDDKDDKEEGDDKDDEKEEL